MGRKVKITINVLALVAIIAYMTVTIVIVNDRSDRIRLNRLEITIEDSSTIGFLTRDSIAAMVLPSIAPIGKPMSEIHLAIIESTIESNPYVDSVQVHSSIDGVISIHLRQHHPVMRVMSENGYNFLIDTSFNIMKPTISYHPQVPIISGMPCFDFAPDFYGKLDVKKYGRDAQNLKKLLNFVNFVTSDEFLDRLCAQIFVTCDHRGAVNIDITPSVGTASIKVGTPDEWEDKLRKIKAFYRSAYSYAGLDTASVVDVRYKNQILVR